MQVALSLAKLAASSQEVPVGAVITLGEEIIASAYNQRESHQNALHHAEILAIEAACQKLGSWRLNHCTLWSTLEPCLMCAGAIYQARLAKVVYGASDPKGGAMGSLFSIHEDTRLNHRLPVEKGLMAEESSALLKAFFRARRSCSPK